MRVGIIIPFYNGHQYLAKLVESFANAAGEAECHLIIVDNSPGNQPVHIAPQSGMKIEVVREKPGIGYGKACNRGYQICRERGYDYLIVANQDGYVSGNFIQDILHPFQQDKEILISAPLLKIYDGHSIEDFFIIYYVSQAPGLLSDLLDGTGGRGYYEMNQVSGACFAFNLKSDRYRYPYFFDPIFHMYSEDDDLCNRIREIKGKIVLVSPNAVFYHQHSYTTDVDNRKVIEYAQLVSEIILRLKKPSKRFSKILYGVFVTTTVNFTYHFLRGEFKKSFSFLRSLAVVLYRLPAIYKSRKRDLLVINAAG